MTAERLRAFVALPLPDTVKAHLAGAQKELQALLPGPALRYVKPEQFHLTLSFLGDISPWQAETVGQVLSRTGPALTPFALETASLGAFPGPQRPSVLWLGVGGNVAALHALQARLEGELYDLGIVRETGRFRPHLSLARVKGLSPTLRREIAGLLHRELLGERTGWMVERVQLLRSQLSAQGASYTVLADAALAEA